MPDAPIKAQTEVTEDDDAGWGGSRATVPAPTSSEPDDDGTIIEGQPPPADADGSSPTDSEPAEESAEEDGAESKKSPETAEQKADREKQEQIAKRWKLVEEAKKGQLRVAAKQRELEASTQKLEQERQQFALERQTHARVVQEAQSILDLVSRVRANPSIDGLKALGFDYMRLTTEMVEANTPEALARAAAEETRRLREQLENQSRQSQTLEVNRRDASNLVAHVDQNSELYPDLATYPVERIAEDGIALRDAHRQQFGRMPTYEWVAQQLQSRAKAFEDSRKARAAQRAGGTSSEQSRASTNGPGHQANRPTGKPSIGNAAVTTRASAPREMTEAEKDEWALDQLRSLRRAR